MHIKYAYCCCAICRNTLMTPQSSDVLQMDKRGSTGAQWRSDGARLIIFRMKRPHLQPISIEGLDVEAGRTYKSDCHWMTNWTGLTTQTAPTEEDRVLCTSLVDLGPSAHLSGKVSVYFLRTLTTLMLSRFFCRSSQNLSVNIEWI